MCLSVSYSLERPVLIKAKSHNKALLGRMITSDQSMREIVVGVFVFNAQPTAKVI